MFHVCYLSINILFCKQTVETLTRRRNLWRLIWVFTIGLCPRKSTLCLNGLKLIVVLDETEINESMSLSEQRILIPSFGPMDACHTENMEFRHHLNREYGFLPSSQQTIRIFAIISTENTGFCRHLNRNYGFSSSYQQKIQIFATISTEHTDFRHNLNRRY